MEKRSRYSRNFKLLLAGANINNISTSMMLVLFPWIILTLTNSSFLAGIELALSDIPLLFSFLVGYYLTKVKRKKAIYVVTTGVRALTLLFIFFVFLTGNEIYELVSIFIGYFITSWTEDVGGQISNYWIKDFLAEDQYKRATSLSHILSMVIYLISYILAGAFIAIGIGFAFPVLILGFALATIIHIFIQPKSYEIQNEQRHSLRDGFSFIWKNKILRILMVEMLLISLGFGGFIILIESLVKFRYGGSSFILTSLLVGAMIGGIFGAKLGGKIRGNPKVFLSTMIFIQIIIVVIIPFIPSYVWLIPDFFILQLTNSAHNVIFSTLFLKATPKDYMMQISGAHKTLALFPAVISSLIIGAIVEFVSLDVTFYFIAILTGITFCFVFTSGELGKISLKEQS